MEEKAGIEVGLDFKCFLAFGVTEHLFTPHITARKSLTTVKQDIDMRCHSAPFQIGLYVLSHLILQQPHQVSISVTFFSQ